MTAESSLRDEIQPRAKRGEGLVRGILITAVFLLVARSFGFVRELFVSSVFGAGEDTDAVYVAVTYLTMMMTIISMVVPTAIARAIYTVEASDGRRRQLWAVIWAWTGFLVLVGLLGFLAPRVLSAMLATSRTPSFQSTLATALRFASLGLVLQGLVIALTSIANAERRHTLAAVVSMGFPLGTMLGVIALGHRMGPMAIFVGAIAISAVQLLVLVQMLVNLGHAPTLVVDRDARAVLLRAASASAPLLIGALVLKLDLPIAIRLATHLEPGSVFVLSLSSMLVNVPMSVTNSAVSQPALPELARASGNPEQFQALFMRTSELALLLVLPVAVFFVVDAPGLVHVLLRRGRFDEQAAIHASSIIQIWGAATWLLVQANYAEDALGAFGRLRLIALLRGLLLPVLAGWMWLGSLWAGLTGIVAGYVIASVLRYIAVMEVLARASHARRRVLWMPTARALIAAACAAAMGVLVRLACTAIAIGPFVRVGLEAIAIGSVTLFAAFVLNMASVRDLVSRMRARFQQV